jgi:hypothetical protein
MEGEMDQWFRKQPKTKATINRDRKTEISKAVQVTDHGGLLGYEVLRIVHRLNNRLTDGGEVSLTRRLPFIPTKILDTPFL